MLAPGFQESAVVVVVGGNLQFVRRSALHRHFYAALALVGVPDAVVEAELNLLLDVAGEVVGHDPARVDVERRFAFVRVRVNNAQLHGIPGRSTDWADLPTLAGRANAREPPAGGKGEVNQLDVVHGDIGARIPALHPFGELAATNLSRLKQGTVAVVDVLQVTLDNVRAQFLVVRV